MPPFRLLRFLRLPLMPAQSRWLIYPLLLAAAAYNLGPRLLHAGPNNGFDLAHALVPADAIQEGGPPRDGIPALDRPRFVAAAGADFLDDTDRVLGVSRNGVIKAYPIRILDYHEIVNDTFGGEAIVVTYCPLCGTGMAFLADVDGKPHRFGVSGLLFNSDVLLYDRETESLWSQLRKQAVTGSLRGATLTQIPMIQTTWRNWRQQHAETLVLSRNTGYHRDYRRSPYGDYATSRRLFFPVSRLDRRYHPKERVVGVEIDGHFKAYPFAELSGLANSELSDRIGAKTIRLQFDVTDRSAEVFDTEGKLLASTIGYWFAWMTFHPDSEVFQAPHG